MTERITQVEFEAWVQDMDEGRNKTFAKGAMNLWIRFKNFEKNAPFALRVDGKIKCVILITKLSRTPYCNLYEIVTATGEEGNGYARRLYWDVLSYFYDAGVLRLKMSCTPDSISWHNGNGIIGWGVDPTGSIRVDIPLKPTREEQLELRENFEENISKIIPPEKVAFKLLNENVSFGRNKEAQVNNSKNIMGKHYRREELLDYYR
jgi:hypothetical protein